MHNYQIGMGLVTFGQYCRSSAQARFRMLRRRRSGGRSCSLNRDLSTVRRRSPACGEQQVVFPKGVRKAGLLVHDVNDVKVLLDARKLKQRSQENCVEYEQAVARRYWWALDEATEADVGRSIRQRFLQQRWQLLLQ